MADGLSLLIYGATDFRLFHAQNTRKRKKPNQKRKESNLQQNLKINQNTKILQLRIMPYMATNWRLLSRGWNG